MPKCCISDITLDEVSLIRYRPEIEHERKVAIYDLLDSNYFAPKDDDQGPYRVRLSVSDTNRLVIDINDENDQPLRRVLVSLMSLRRVVKDYFKICESYFDALQKRTVQQLESIDMARRGLHDEGANLLIERLADKIDVDADTARRLFTLICVLHIRA
ncbi:MAG: hypothetical protein CMM41_00650 [Rhodospirillaceae bacterium]|nr:hypothetical protein [Rhodospirillaceae bacterium]